MMDTKFKLFTAVIILFFGQRSFAQIQLFPMSVNAESLGDSVSAAPAAGMVTRGGDRPVTIKIHNSCFPTNLRSVANPIAPNSIIKASFNLYFAGADHIFWVEYPAALVTAKGMCQPLITPMDASKYSVDTISSAGIYGNTVVLNTNYKTGVTVDSAGVVTLGVDKKVALSSITFYQTVTTCASGPVYGSYGHSSYTPTYACGAYMGKNGPLSAALGGIVKSADTSSIDISVSFPGQTGFCGGYWSPLMLFIDDQRPNFDNTSKFPLNPGGETMWPKANHPGWFLAIDRDGNGLIDQKNEIFGADDELANGFEALKKLDINKDGVIDLKDKEFKNLLLWKDINGDGISQKDELIKLSDKVTKISLKYNKDTIQILSKNAQERERSIFWLKDPKGKIIKGEIIDIWIAPNN